MNVKQFCPFVVHPEQMAVNVVLLTTPSGEQTPQLPSWLILYPKIPPMTIPSVGNQSYLYTLDSGNESVAIDGGSGTTACMCMKIDLCNVCISVILYSRTSIIRTPSFGSRGGRICQIIEWINHVLIHPL